MLDNVADLVLMVSLLSATFQFPANFALRYMVPGTAVGVLVGDLCFTWMAFRLARRTGRTDVTAMPLGLDTPSTFGVVFFVLGPAFLAAKSAGMAEELAARHAWHIGVCMMIASGLIKLACATVSNWVRRSLPRAGLLGSLAAIALVIISFMPLVEISHYPLVGMVSLAVILTSLVARVELPFRMPGALAALLAGTAMYYGLRFSGWVAPEVSPIDPKEALWPTEWLMSFRMEWVAAAGDSLAYLPVVLPFTLATIVGGIDCTESAAAAGDEYDTGTVIAVEGVATLAAGLCGAVIQTTPYIGHPAYKAMGGRAAYTLATALFVGTAGLLGYFGYLYEFIPKSAIFPILVFVGLEITAQSFHATPVRHYPAVGIACVPALAYLVLAFTDQVQAATGTLGPGMDKLGEALARNLQTLRMLSGGFIVTSLLWASALAALVDRRLRVAAGFYSLCAVFSLFGVIHSPLDGSRLFLPWELPAEATRFAPGQAPAQLALAYLAMATILLVWSLFIPPTQKPQEPADVGE